MPRSALGVMRKSARPGATSIRRRLKELVAQAMLNAQAPAARPLARIDVPAKLADRLIDSGEIEQARKLLQEAEHFFKEMTKNASRPSYVLGQVANVLARIDLPAALAILDDLERTARKSESRDRTNIFDRFYGTIAYNLAAAIAGRCRASAEPVVASIGDGPSCPRGLHQDGACGPGPSAADRRFADFAGCSGVQALYSGVDGPGDRRHAEGRSDSLDRRGISRAGRPCRRLASRSRALIPSRWQRVYSPSSSRWNRSDWLSASVARLPCGRQAEIKPIPVRSPSCTATPGWWRWLPVTIANWPARLLEPELREVGNHPTRSGRGDSATANVLSALALIDPQQAVERVLALPDDTGAGTDPFTRKNWARIEVAKVLAVHGADRWRLVCASLESVDARSG